MGFVGFVVVFFQWKHFAKACQSHIFCWFNMVQLEQQHRFSMIFHRFSMIFHDFPWFSIDFPWFSTYFPWFSIDFPWRSTKNTRPTWPNCCLFGTLDDATSQAPPVLWIGRLPGSQPQDEGPEQQAPKKSPWDRKCNGKFHPRIYKWMRTRGTRILGNLHIYTNHISHIFLILLYVGNVKEM